MPPKLTWIGKKGQVYFIDYAPFSDPDNYQVIDGPIHGIAGEMEWRGTECKPGNYTVGTEYEKQIAMVRHLPPDGMMVV